MTPVALLVHVPNVQQGLEWYSQAFPMAVQVTLDSGNFTALRIQGFLLELVQADEKVGVGKCGTVLYWSVESVTDTVLRLEALGASLYRGPMSIEAGELMCQLEDPFGNLIGLRGRD